MHAVMVSRPDPNEPVVGEGEMGGPTIELPTQEKQLHIIVYIHGQL